MEDALEATKAAVDEGILPGGGVALVNGANELDGLKLEGDEAVGVKILRRALEAPLRQLADNAGFEGAIVVERVKKKKAGIGFDVVAEEYRIGAAECGLDRGDALDDRRPSRRDQGGERNLWLLELLDVETPNLSHDA